MTCISLHVVKRASVLHSWEDVPEIDEADRLYFAKFLNDRGQFLSFAFY